ncbi:MAG: hypothetical protein GEU98_23805 [Pseudonocardiaceae bacterium]|nr:hypothetical protein [Pseudonocardiaceae bacterium]
MRRRVRAGRAVGVVCTLLVLLAVALAGYLAWGDGSNPVYTKYHVSTPDLEPRRPEPVTPPDPLVRPAGSIVMDRDGRPGDFFGKSSLTKREVWLLVRNGVAQMQAIITKDRGTTRAVWRFTVRDSDDPRRARDALDELYERGGYQVRPTRHPGVRVRRIANPADQRDITAYRSHYVRGRDVLRVEVYGANAPVVESAFRRLLDKQVDAFPAGRR